MSSFGTTVLDRKRSTASLPDSKQSGSLINDAVQKRILQSRTSFTKKFFIGSRETLPEFNSSLQLDASTEINQERKSGYSTISSDDFINESPNIVDHQANMEESEKEREEKSGTKMKSVSNLGDELATDEGGNNIQEIGDSNKSKNEIKDVNEKEETVHKESENIKEEMKFKAAVLSSSKTQNKTTTNLMLQAVDELEEKKDVIKEDETAKETEMFEDKDEADNMKQDVTGQMEVEGIKSLSKEGDCNNETRDLEMNGEGEMQDKTKNGESSQKEKGKEEDRVEDKDEERENEEEGVEISSVDETPKTPRSLRTDDVISIELALENETKVDSSLSLDHENLVERLKQTNQELAYVKRKHRFLTKEVFEIKGRKVDVAAPEPELTQKYFKKIILYEKMKYSVRNEMKKITDQMNYLKERQQKSEEIFKAEQDEFLQKICESGRKLVDFNSGKPVPEENILQQTNRIQMALANTGRMRLKMIKLQKHLAKKESELKNLDSLEGDLHLIDYEKLRIYNQQFVDTIEERVEELSRLRKKILTDTHILAHVRDSIDSIVEDTKTYYCILQGINANINSVREDTKKLKQKKHIIIAETEKMKQEAGILTKPKIASSFEERMSHLNSAKNQLNGLMQLFEIQEEKITKLGQQTSEARKLYENSLKTSFLRLS